MINKNMCSNNLLVLLKFRLKNEYLIQYNIYELSYLFNELDSRYNFRIN